MGRLTKDPQIRYTQDGKAIADFSLAVNRRGSKEAAQTADFISCVAFGKSAEILEKYVHQGTKLLVTGSIATGSYTNKEGQKVYTTKVNVTEIEFAESKNASANTQSGNAFPTQQTPVSTPPQTVQPQNAFMPEQPPFNEGFEPAPEGFYGEPFFN